MGSKVIHAQVVINEVMYDLPGADSGREWIEIKNVSSSPIDIVGWKITDNNQNHKPCKPVQGGTSIIAGGYAIIVENSAKFLLDWPGFQGTIVESAFSLSNDTETLALKEHDRVVDAITYTTPPNIKVAENSLQKMEGGVWKFSAPTPGENNVFTAMISLGAGNTAKPTSVTIASAPETISKSIALKTITKRSGKKNSVVTDDSSVTTTTPSSNEFIASPDQAFQSDDTNEVSQSSSTGLAKWIWIVAGIIAASIISLFFLPQKRTSQELTADDIEIVED